MGNYCDGLLKTIGCFDVTDDLGDFMWDVQTHFGQRLLTSSFKWNSIFVGVNVNDEVIRKLPVEGKALLTLFGQFSDIAFSCEDSSRSVDLPGECLMMMPRHAKSKGKTKGLCYCVVLYFQGVTPLVVPNGRSSSVSTAVRAPKSTPIAATSQVCRRRTIVQACCEPENYIHRKTKYSA
jgi:hypothetical protein